MASAADGSGAPDLLEAAADTGSEAGNEVEPGSRAGAGASGAAPDRPNRRILTVDIFGRRYKIETEHDPDTIRALASYLDRRMRAISRRTEPGDVVGAAVLAALNITDDYYQTRRALEQREEDITERTRELVERIDRALGQVD